MQKGFIIFYIVKLHIIRPFQSAISLLALSTNEGWFLEVSCCSAQKNGSNVNLLLLAGFSCNHDAAKRSKQMCRENTSVEYSHILRQYFQRFANKVMGTPVIKIAGCDNFTIAIMYNIYRKVFRL